MIIYYNPHVDDFLAEPLQFRILGRRALKKYGFLLDEALRNNSPVRVLVDGTASGLIPERLFHRLPRWLRYSWSKLEYRLWKRINDLGEEVQCVDIPEAAVDDVLLAFSYKAATGRFALREPTLKYYRAVVFHLSHYFLATAEKADNIRRLPNVYLAGDSDISEVPYFRRYFEWYNKPFLILPFAVGERFVNKQPWTSRESRVVATGSFHDLRLERPKRKYADFMTATGATTYHPVRLALHQLNNDLAPWLDCKVSPYRQYGQNRLSRLLSHFKIGQKKYFSINIVELYNQHKFAIVGEELSGFPALGAVEAMACGCLLIAQPQYYKGLGLVPNKHYLPYDGDIHSLPEIVQTNNNKTLYSMAKETSEFVRKEFSEESLFSKWMHEIRRLT